MFVCFLNINSVLDFSFFLYSVVAREGKFCHKQGKEGKKVVAELRKY